MGKGGVDMLRKILGIFIVFMYILAAVCFVLEIINIQNDSFQYHGEYFIIGGFLMLWGVLLHIIKGE